MCLLHDRDRRLRAWLVLLHLLDFSLDRARPFALHMGLPHQVAHAEVIRAAV